MAGKRKRKRKLKKSFKIFLATLILVLCAGGYLYYIYTQMQAAPPPEGEVIEKQEEETEEGEVLDNGEVDTGMDNLTFTVLNTGDGESILVQCGETEALIDTGTEDSSSEVCKYISAETDGSLEYVILTNDTPERAGGLKGISKKFDVKNVILGNTKDSKFREYKFMFPQSKVEKGNDATIELGERAGINLYALDVVSDEKDDHSLIVEIGHGMTSFLVESDAGAKEEARITSVVGGCNVFVAAQHGGLGTNTNIEPFNPNYVVVSTSKDTFKNNKEKFLELTGGRTVYTTEKSGHIKFSSDGEMVTCEAPEDEAYRQ